MKTEPLVIRPEILAQKLDALRNFAAPTFAAAVAACPRLIELLWFIQWFSLQPGGLPKFVERFLALCGNRIGTGVMHRIGKTDEPYTAQERQEVIESIPEWTMLKVFGRQEENPHVSEILNEFNNEMRGEDSYGLAPRGRPNLALVNKRNHAYFYGCCDEIAMTALPDGLFRFCTKPDAVLPDAWYFADLQGALMEMMDAHKAGAEQRLPKTIIAEIVHETMDFAWEYRTMAELIGDSRFGKTESIKTWCDMYPGRVRLVKTPCDNLDRSLLEALAKAAGIEVTLNLTGRELKTKVEYVLTHSGLMWVFDEAAWLLPQRYTAKTVPMRLNYVSSQILENGCPVVLVKTPQYFDEAAKTFEKVTCFNMVQFRSRIKRSVELPKELPEKDLYAVVDAWLPGLFAGGSKRIVGVALSSETYLSAVENIATNAGAVAKKKGHAQIQPDDLEEGIALSGIVIPSINAAAPATTAVTKPAAESHDKPRSAHRGRPPRSVRTAPATPAPAPAAVPVLEMPSREIMPAATVLTA
jgi:hypothetical protein